MADISRVKLTSKLVGDTAKLTVGDTIIPLYEATIHIKVGELVTITATVAAESIDVEALQEQTELIIKERPEAKE